MYDIIIVGCGPAGLSAAIYALRSGKKVLLFEKETIGGNITSSPLIENYPGFQKISGPSFAHSLYEQVLSLGGIIEIEEVIEVIPGKVNKIITDLGEYQTKCVILAVGSSYKKLGLEGEEELIGNGISFCTICDGAFYKNKKVAVVGGGNSALESALALAPICKEVHLLVRADEIKGEQFLKKQMADFPNIKLHLHTIIKKLVGTDALQSLLIDDGEEKMLDVEGLFVAIGQTPATKYIKNIITLDPQQYILAGEDCKTNIKGIFAAGDCRSKLYRQLTTAVSDGTAATLAALQYLKENT